MTNIFGYIETLARWIELRANAAGRLLVSSQSEPIVVGAIFNEIIAINTDFFDADLVPTNTPTTFRISICMDAAGVLNVMREQLLPAPPVTTTEHLNAGVDLAADCLYEINITVAAGQTINLQHSVGGTILSCTVVEVYG